MKSLKSAAGEIGLREDVLAELEWDPRIDPSKLHVHAEDGAVSLRGTVTTYAQRHAAVRAAERVQGVKAVADDIEVVLSRDVERKDSELAAEIAHERSWNTALPDTVDVEVRSGQVLLRGYVAHPYQRQEVVRAVRHLAGVRGVASSIDVKRSPTSSAVDIEQQIGEAIGRSAALDAQSIRVTKTADVITWKEPCIRSQSAKRRSALPRPGWASHTSRTTSWSNRR
jgi:osmotically-inducible protein OsmY